MVKTDPKAGSTVKEGSSVKLYKSIGKPKTQLIDVKGRQIGDAKKR